MESSSSSSASSSASSSLVSCHSLIPTEGNRIDNDKREKQQQQQQKQKQQKQKQHQQSNTSDVHNGCHHNADDSFFHRIMVYLHSLFMYIATRFFSDLSWAASRDRRNPFTQTPTVVLTVKNAVLKTPSVLNAIAWDSNINSDYSWTQSKRNNTSNAHRNHAAKDILDTMACNVNFTAVRIACYLFRKVFRIMYLMGTTIKRDEVDRLQACVAEHPTVFLPTHKSHMDYLILLYHCFDQGLPIPAVVAGENLNMPVIGTLLRWGGAVFIKRSFPDDDPLYKAIFTAYLNELLRLGCSIECFIEGSRSRTHKVLPPKIGFLKAVVEICVDEGVDAYVVPISMSYDRIVENETYLEELSLVNKHKERLVMAVRGATGVVSRAWYNSISYGRVDVRIAEPISILHFVAEQRKAPTTRQLSLSTITQGATSEQMPALSHRYDITQLSYSLGYRTLYECNRNSVVSPSALVVTVLLSYFQRGISRFRLLKEVTVLRDELLKRGAKVAFIDEDTVDLVVTNVLGVKLGKNILVKRHKDRLMVSLYSPKERLELSLFRNQLIHHFVEESIISCALYMFEKDRGEGQGVTKEDLYNAAVELSRLLRYEFIYTPSPAASQSRSNFDRALQLMMDRGILCTTSVDSNDLIIVDESFTSCAGAGMTMYLFLCSTIWHFIDSYWLASLSLIFLLPSRVMMEDVLLRKMQKIGDQCYYDGQCDLYECMNSEGFRNALTLFERMSVIEFLTVEGSKVPTSRIARLHYNMQTFESVEGLIMQIARFRKRSRAYRSRRFALTLQRLNDVTDAIEMVRELIRREKEEDIKVGRKHSVRLS